MAFFIFKGFTFLGVGIDLVGKGDNAQQFIVRARFSCAISIGLSLDDLMLDCGASIRTGISTLSLPFLLWRIINRYRYMKHMHFHFWERDSWSSLHRYLLWNRAIRYHVICLSGVNLVTSISIHFRRYDPIASPDRRPSSLVASRSSNTDWS